VNTLLSKGAHSKCNAQALFFQSGPLTSLISSASYSNLGYRSFVSGLGDEGTEFWVSCDSVPPIWGYGVQLIRLWLRQCFCLWCLIDTFLLNFGNAERLCLFCLMRQRHCWKYFAFNHSYGKRQN